MYLCAICSVYAKGHWISINIKEVFFFDNHYVDDLRKNGSLFLKSRADKKTRNNKQDMRCLGPR